MQLNTKLSIVTASLLLTNSIYAKDYVRINIMKYDESNNRVKVIAPAMEINKDIGVDYTINTKLIFDSVSGATPIYSDTSSGGSAFARGHIDDTSNIKQSNVKFNEKRKGASIALTKRFDNRNELTTSFNKSYESDYDANTLGINYLMWQDHTKNKSYNFGLSYSRDNILIRNCSYNQVCGTPDTISGASQKKTSTTIETQIGITQLINKTSLITGSIFYNKENGYLSNPYYNVVRNSNMVVAEYRPDIRIVNGFNIQYTKAFWQNTSTKFRYRFSNDDWGIKSDTYYIHHYYELLDKYTFGFGVRYYDQTRAKFYNSSTTYFTDEKYASSDTRLSEFSSTTYSMSVDYKYSESISCNIGINVYSQTTNLKAKYTTIGLKYSF